MEITDFNPYYVSGFADGEGCVFHFIKGMVFD